jgi:chaperone modulatory protein CbpM
MSTRSTAVAWLNDVELCPIEHLAETSGLAIEDIEDLIANGVIQPAPESGGRAAQTRLFHLRYVVTVKTAARLRDDFELERHGMTLAVTLLQRIEQLQAQLVEMRAHGAPY